MLSLGNHPSKSGPREQGLRDLGAQCSVETCVVDLVSWLGLLPGEGPQPPMFAAGQPGLPVPGLHLPPAQPEDAAALPAGTRPRPRPHPHGCLECLTPASVLHLHFCLLQNKNGDGVPSAVAPRVQRPPTAAPAAPSSSSKQPTADTEASEQRALHVVQYGLLKILSRTLAALRHFTPDVCQILLDQVPAPSVLRPQPPTVI